MSEFGRGDQRARHVQQQLVEESRINFDIGQLASEVRKLTERQDSLLSLLNRSSQVRSSVDPASGTDLSGRTTPEELTWTNNIAQRYWASLIPTDETIANAVGLFLGNAVGETHWLKKASCNHTFASPRVEVIHESGNGDTIVKTNYTSEWEPCVVESELESRYYPFPTQRHEDTETIVAGVRNTWPISLSEEFYD